MIDALNPVVLMAGASLAVITAGGGLFAADRRVRAARQRISNIAAAHSPTSRPVLETRRPWSAADDGVGTLGRMLAYLRVETDRPDLYPMPWWTIFLLTSMVAVAVAGAAGFFMDRSVGSRCRSTCLYLFAWSSSSSRTAVPPSSIRNFPMPWR